jgi:hypothetical protein
LPLASTETRGSDRKGRDAVRGHEIGGRCERDDTRGTPAISRIGRAPRAVPFTDVTTTESAPGTVFARTIPVRVPPALTAHCTPGVPGSTSPSGGRERVAHRERSPAWTTFDHASATRLDTTEAVAAPSATSVSGVTVSVTLPVGTFAWVTTVALATPSVAPDPFASITSIRPGPPRCVSRKTKAAESEPAATVTWKIRRAGQALKGATGAVRPEREGFPRGQARAVSEGVAHVRDHGVRDAGDELERVRGEREVVGGPGAPESAGEAASEARGAAEASTTRHATANAFAAAPRARARKV